MLTGADASARLDGARQPARMRLPSEFDGHVQSGDFATLDILVWGGSLIKDRAIIASAIGVLFQNLAGQTLPLDITTIVGSHGVIHCRGPDNQRQELFLVGEREVARPVLKGTWFPDGFHGAMAELLTAVEEDREPTHNARRNLESLALCFAACASAETGLPQVPGEVTHLP